MAHILTIVLYQPILNALLFVQRYLPGHDMGLAIIIVTLLIKGLLYAPSLSAIRSSRQLQSLQPRLKALQEQYKNNREQLAQEQMKLYRESKVNPLSSCLGPLIQLPILIALYQVFLHGLRIDSHGLLAASQLQHVYGPLRDYFAHTPMNTMFLGWVNVAKTHNIILAVLAGAATFWQTSMIASPKEPNTPGAQDEAMTSMINKQSKYLLPLVTVLFSYRFAAGLGLYWLTSTLFTVGQQYIFLRSHPMNGGNPPAPQSKTQGDAA
jgi:YidC/Oxa1 family membrane protein insertase